MHMQSKAIVASACSISRVLECFADHDERLCGEAKTTDAEIAKRKGEMLYRNEDGSGVGAEAERRVDDRRQ